MRMRRITLVSLLAASMLAFSAGTAMGDTAISQPAPTFRLNPATLEPGAVMLPSFITFMGVDVDQALHVGFVGDALRVSVLDNGLSVDQVLVPASDGGYQVINRFNVGSGLAGVEQIDPGFTAS